MFRQNMVFNKWANPLSPKRLQGQATSLWVQTDHQDRNTMPRTRKCCNKFNQCQTFHDLSLSLYSWGDPTPPHPPLQQHNGNKVKKELRWNATVLAKAQPLLIFFIFSFIFFCILLTGYAFWLFLSRKWMFRIDSNHNLPFHSFVFNHFLFIPRCI